MAEFPTPEQREQEHIEWEKMQRNTEKQKFRRIIRLAKKLCPIDYVKLCYEIEYRLNIPYNHTTKAPYSRYLDTLIGIGRLKKSENGTITLGETQK